ncbi:MAG: TIGR00159 family protein [Planctomycetes bacterium]|nr:TIGR00159 family protein [Planctomycetota bacterium]
MLDLFEPLANWKAVVEVLILATVLYGFLRLLQESLGPSVLRGLSFFTVVLLVVLLFVARKFDMRVITALLTNFPKFIAIALLIIFQPELRRAMVRLGESPMLRRVFRAEGDALSSIVNAVTTMSEQHIGALIAIERDVPLTPYVDGGIKMDSRVTRELLVTIFYPGTPLHDGAAIIRGDRVIAAACLFPLTENPEVSRGLGTRHRAGIGVTEQSDAIAIMVSEETGAVSVAVRGTLTRGMKGEELDRVLREIYLEKKESPKDSEVSSA